MVSIVKIYKRNSEGEQWYDTEVFYTEQDALTYVDKEVRTLMDEGFEVKKEETHHRYLLDEEQGDEVEYIIQEKRVRGKIVYNHHQDDIKFSMNQVIPNGWEMEWVEGDFGGAYFTIFKRFESEEGNQFLIHMNFNSMKMVYVKDENRKYSEDRGSFEISATWEPNEFLLLDEHLGLPRIHKETFEQYHNLISQKQQEEIVETFERSKLLWHKMVGGE